MKSLNKIVPLLVCILPNLSVATLGEGAASITNDNNALAARVSQVVPQSLSNNKYQTSIIKTSNNITLKEFLANGKVFAITWNGPVYPDLKQLLGTYFPQMKTATKAMNDLTSLRLNGQDFVFLQSGLPGMLSGLAYVPSLVPAGVNVFELK